MPHKLENVKNYALPSHQLDYQGIEDKKRRKKKKRKTITCSTTTESWPHIFELTKSVKQLVLQGYKLAAVHTITNITATGAKLFSAGGFLTG